MKVDRTLVLHIARLAHLELTEAEIDLFTIQLSSILSYVDQLKEVQEEAEAFTLDFLEPFFREDKVNASLPVERVMQNAPDHRKNLFRVPRIIP